jgi:hypothetical protein
MEGPVNQVLTRVHAVQEHLPVLGAWGYVDFGDLVIVVIDDSYSADDVKRIQGLVEMSVNGGVPRPRGSHRPTLVAGEN